MTCPACRHDRARFVLRAHDTDLVRCRGCGLVRVDPLPEAGAVLAQYDAAYFENPDRGYLDYVADEEVFRAEFRRRLRTIRAAGGAGRLLDVGCASGALISEAALQGFHPRGLEPAAAMARRAAERTGLPVQAASLSDVLIAAASLDVVTMFDVLEHLVDPLEALGKLRLGLRPGGLLAVTVPDFGSWWARLSGPRWPLLTPWEHVLHFTRPTLADVLRRAGFGRIRFHAARVPVSLATAAAKGAPPLAVLPRRFAHRDVSLPVGTIFALAEARLRH